jgi:hypothetical protein
MDREDKDKYHNTILNTYWQQWYYIENNGHILKINLIIGFIWEVINHMGIDKSWPYYKSTMSILFWLSKNETKTPWKT